MQWVAPIIAAIASLAAAWFSYLTSRNKIDTDKQLTALSRDLDALDNDLRRYDELLDLFIRGFNGMDQDPITQDRAIVDLKNGADALIAHPRTNGFMVHALSRITGSIDGWLNDPYLSSKPFATLQREQYEIVLSKARQTKETMGMARSVILKSQMSLGEKKKTDGENS